MLVDQLRGVLRLATWFRDVEVAGDIDKSCFAEKPYQRTALSKLETMTTRPPLAPFP